MSKVPMSALAAIGVAIVISACGSSHATEHQNKPQSAAPAVAASTSLSCVAQVQGWSDGGASEMRIIAADLIKSGRAATSGSLGTLQGDVTTLAADAQADLGSRPPSCVPGMATDYATAMDDFIAAADSVNQGTVSGVQTATQQMTAGGDALARADHDLQQFKHSNGLG